MPVLGIDAVSYGVDDVQTCTRFFRAFGLGERESGPAGASFEVPGEGAEVMVRHYRDAGLPPGTEGRPTVREIVWGVSDSGELQRIGASLEAQQPVTLGGDGVLRTVDPSGQALAFRVTTVTRVSPHDNGKPSRYNERADFVERALPTHLGHIVLMTPKADEVMAFYREHLGFTLSDAIKGHGVFLRAGGATNHHNLFLIEHHRPGLHHLSFRVESIDHIGVGREQMQAQGWRTVWGIGRHRIGSDQFVYFKNPAGGLAEYHADEDVIIDPAKWQPREWDARESGYWGGPPPAETRH